MSFWSIIKPEETTNLFIDPVFGADDPDTAYDISATGGSSPDVVKIQTDCFEGDGCAEFDFDGASNMTMKDDVTVTATSYTLSCYIKRAGGGVVSSGNAQARFNTANVNFDSYTLIRDGWYYCVYTATATAGAREFGIFVGEDGIKTDGWQLENKAYATTLAYGSKVGNRSDGYTWSGTAHASTSARHAQERSGGRELDLTDTFNFYIQQHNGAGVPPQVVTRVNAAQLDGSIYQRAQYRERVLTLAGLFNGTSVANLHSLRNDMTDAVRRDLVTPQQSFFLRYSGNTVPLECAFYYEGGLDLVREAEIGFTEQVPARFFAPNPFWTEYGNEVAVLDTQDTLTTNYIAQKSSGTWRNLATNLNNTVRALVKTPDQSIYIGGDITAPSNYVARWNGTTIAALSSAPDDTINAMVVDGTNVIAGGAHENVERWNGTSTWTDFGTAPLGANNAIYAILVDGTDIYLGGEFTQIGGKSINYCAKLDTTTGIISEIDSGFNASVRAFTKQATSGDIIIGGEFTNVGDANGDYIVSYNGSSVSSLGTGAASSGVFALTLDSGNSFWAGGTFTGMGGVANTNSIAYWNGIGWAAVGTGATTGNGVYGLDTDSSGDLYAVGTYTQMGGVANTTRAAKWNGSVWAALSTGLSATARCVVVDGNDDVFVGGNAFAFEVHVYKWNGSAWSGVGNLNDTVWAIDADTSDTLYIGDADSSGSALKTWTGSAWSEIGSVGSNVYAARVDGSDDVLIGGDFTSPFTRAGKYDVSETSTVGVFSVATFDNDINTLSRDSEGNIYIGGAYTDVNDDGTDYIVKADSSEVITYFDDVPNGIVHASVIDTSNNLYIAGAFTTVGATTVNRVAKWDGTTWSALDSGVSGTCRAIAINPTDGYIWVAGDSGLLAFYNGSVWTTVTTSTSSTIYTLAFDDDGELYLGGDFTSIGGLTITGLARYKSEVWFQTTVILPASTTVYAILIDGSEVTIGFDTAGNSTVPGTTTVTVNSTANTFPVFEITGPGDLRQITNETTEKTIQFTDLTLGATETVTLDLGIFAKSLKSDSRIPEKINSKMLQSDITQFALQKGNNDISVLVTDASSSAIMRWKLTHLSVDGGV